MKVLITGANGQLGNEMRSALKNASNIEALFTDIADLDICNSLSVNGFISENKPDIIVNCAAYTAVDKAEDDEERCAMINCEAVKNIGEAAARNNAKVIHISTDYVFDGTTHIPYSEKMDTHPNTVYGKTKLAGEDSLKKVCPNNIIIRTAWLYSSFGNNFVKTILRLGKEKEKINVVFDQIGTPTYAADLADAIVKILSSGKFTCGTFHFSNEGVCSWYDFTKAIFRIADIKCAVSPIESSEYPARAPRPYYSVLNKSKIKETYGIAIPHWEESLKKCIKLL